MRVGWLPNHGQLGEVNRSQLAQDWEHGAMRRLAHRRHASAATHPRRKHLAP